MKLYGKILNNFDMVDPKIAVFEVKNVFWILSNYVNKLWTLLA